MAEVLVSVAGFDPSGGAGVLLDVAVFRSFGFPGAAVLTAVTAQNSRSVQAIRNLGGRFLGRQYETLVEDVALAGVKVGMLGGLENIAVLGRILDDQRHLPIVVDPVFRSSSGRWLLEKKSIPAYLDRIKGRITLLTPNLDEAALISGRPLRRPEDMQEAALLIAERVASPCLVKGGHLAAGKVVDVLCDGQRCVPFPHGKRAEDVHGTGCLLSSSLLCYLVMRKPLIEACSLAIDFTQRAMKRARRLGKGRAVFTVF